MADIFDKKKRSAIMAAVKSAETKPEILIRKELFAKGFRFRKNVASMPGKPDIILPKYKTVIFINGCFWHGHKNCKAAILPKSRIDYWSKKINSNIARDKKNIRLLRKLGWRIIIVWECKINNEVQLLRTINKITKFLNNYSPC